MLRRKRIKMTKLNDINLHDVGDTIQLVGSVWAGNGKMYLALFPEDRGTVYSGQHKVMFTQKAWDDVSFDASDEAEVHVLDMDSADWEKFLRQTDLLETEVLAKASDGTLAKVIVRKSQRNIEAGISWKVFKRDHYTCRYCGKDDLSLTVDHLVLWEVGGPSIEANLVAACKKCNKTRGRLPYDQWLQSDHYLRVAVNLTETQRKANLAVAGTLKDIPVNVNQRSR